MIKMGLTDYVKAWVTYPTTYDYPQVMPYVVGEAAAFGFGASVVLRYLTQSPEIGLQSALLSIGMTLSLRSLQYVMFGLGRDMDQYIEDPNASIDKIE